MNSLDIGVMVKEQNNIKTFFTKNGVLENTVAKNLSTLFRVNTQNQQSEVINSADFNGGPVIETEEKASQTEKRIFSSDQCSICNVTYQSIQDKPPKGVINSFWFGCSAAKCNYWLHSYCFGIYTARSEFQKDWAKVKWVCPDHQKKS